MVFGDVLASEVPLRWVMVTDEFGTDPTLRLKETTLQVNTLTMISKRLPSESIGLAPRRQTDLGQAAYAL